MIPAEPPRRWTAAGAAARAWRGFRDGWRAAPAAGRRHWLRTMGYGTLVCWALSAGITYVVRGWEAAGALDWEPRALLRLAEVSPLSFAAAIWAEQPGSAILLIPATFAGAVLAVRSARPVLAATLVANYFVLDSVVGVGWLLWSRARPIMIAGGAASPGLNSFPSGHVAQTMAAWGILAFLWIRSTDSALERVLAVLLAVGAVVLVALARLRLGTHWPSDVVATVPLGIAWLLVVTYALRGAEARGAR